MAKMNVTITPNGDVKMHVEGVKGKKCLDLTQEFEKAIGEVTKRKLTSEYYKEHFAKRDDFLKETE